MYRVYSTNLSLEYLFFRLSFWANLEQKYNPKKKTSGCSPLSFLFRVLKFSRKKPAEIFKRLLVVCERRKKENHMCFSHHHPRLALFCISLLLLFLRTLGLGRIKVTRQRNDFDESAEKTDWGERCVGFDREERRCLF